MGPIQRYPFGMLETLAIKGVAAPSNLSETVAPTMEMLQFYGNQQRQLLTGVSAGLARGANLQAGNSQQWCIVYGANVEITKTATMLLAGLSVFVSGPFATIFLASDFWTVGAAVADGKWRLSWVAPYPMVFGPNTSFFANLDSCTDAAAAVSVSFSVGILG